MRFFQISKKLFHPLIDTPYYHKARVQQSIQGGLKRKIQIDLPCLFRVGPQLKKVIHVINIVQNISITLEGM